MSVDEVQLKLREWDDKVKSVINNDSLTPQEKLKHFTNHKKELKEHKKELKEYIKILKDKKWQSDNEVRALGNIIKCLEYIQSRRHEYTWLLNRITPYERMKSNEVMETCRKLNVPYCFLWQNKEMRVRLDSLSDEDLSYYNYFNGAFGLNCYDASLTRKVYNSYYDIWGTNIRKTIAVAHSYLDYHAYAFERGGKQIFHIMPKVLDMFLQTDPKIDSYFLKMPYNSFYIQLPYGVLTAFDWDEYNNVPSIRFADGIFVSAEDYRGDIENSINEGKIYIHDNLNIKTIIRILIIGNCDVKGPEKFYNDYGYFAKFYFGEHGNTMEYFDMFNKTVLEEINMQSEDDFNEDEMKQTIKESETQMMIDGMRIVLNTILYLNSNDVDGEICENKEYGELMDKMKRLGGGGSKKGSRILQKTSNMTRLTKIVLGKNITSNIPEGFNRRNKLTKKFMVRGYFRTYRHERYSEQLREKTSGQPQWIKPYWKGPDMAEILQRKYVLDKV